MSYRKIEVDGCVFEYTIGRTHVKIKGVGAFSKFEVGETVEVPDYCDCGCGLTYSEAYDREPRERKQTGVVTPHIIRSLIKGRV